MAHGFDDLLDARGYKIRRLDLVVLDVDDADGQADLRIKLLEQLQLFVAAARELEYEMVGVQRVQKGDQVAPEPLQHRLPAVVAETDVHRPLVRNAVQDMVDRLDGPGRVLRVAGDARLVELHGVGIDQLELPPQHGGAVHRHVLDIAVVIVGQQARQHVRPGAGELERCPRQRTGKLRVAGQIQRPVANAADDDAGGGQPIALGAVRPVAIDVSQREVVADPVHPRHEVVDHPVRLGVARVEASELAVAHQVEAGELLRLQDGHDRVAQHQAGGVANHPWQNGITADDGRPDPRGHAVAHDILTARKQASYREKRRTEA